MIRRAIANVCGASFKNEAAAAVGLTGCRSIAPTTGTHSSGAYDTTGLICT